MARRKPYKEYVTDEIKEMIPKWKRQGQKDDWIAKKIGVGRDLLMKWKKEYSDFDHLFKIGTADLLLELEETLYTRAKGHMVTEKEITVDNMGKKIVKTKEKYIWSDPCLSMALKKLDPDKWGDNQQEETQEEKLKRLLEKLDDKL